MKMVVNIMNKEYLNHRERREVNKECVLSEVQFLLFYADYKKHCRGRPMRLPFRSNPERTIGSMKVRDCHAHLRCARKRYSIKL
jgi:hypothetical protein